jgi:very-short-patch-repair endonuclease
MKRTLLYGKVDNLFPCYEGFQIHADGSLDLRLSSVNIFAIERDDEGIRWIDLFNSQLHNLLDSQERLEASLVRDHNPFATFDKYTNRFWNSLQQYCNPKSHAEQDFFALYCNLCFRDNGPDALLPALIPHVYINWYSTQEKRRTNEEPYIVDFVFKSPVFGTNSLVVVEIDGPSPHYASYDPNRKQYTVDETIYAKHLKKDRWLRKQGFKVFRIGNSEIRSITSLPEEDRLKEFHFFFREVFGEIISIDEYDSNSYFY